MAHLWTEAEMDGETESCERDGGGSICIAWMASGLMWAMVCSSSVILRDNECCGLWIQREGGCQKEDQGLSCAQSCETADTGQNAKGSRLIQIILLYMFLQGIWCQGDLGTYYVFRIKPAMSLTQFFEICWPWSHIEFRTPLNSVKSRALAPLHPFPIVITKYPKQTPYKWWFIVWVSSRVSASHCCRACGESAREGGGTQHGKASVIGTRSKKGRAGLRLLSPWVI